MSNKFEDCATRSEIERYIELNLLQQADTAKRIREYSNHVRTTKKLEEVDVARTSLRTGGGILVAEGALATLLQTASQASSEISQRVQEKKTLWLRSKASREYLDQVNELREAIVATYAAMDEKDWDRAASQAAIARKVPTEILHSDFAAKMVPTIELPDPPPELLQSACDDLAALFAREFDKATQTRQMDELTRYFKLFPLVGHDSAGLEKYSKFICQIIAGHSRTLLLVDDVNYGQAMSRLLEHVAVIVNQHAPLIQRHYSADAMEKVIATIQDEVDRQAGLIIDTLWDERRLERLLDSCNAYSFPILMNSFAPDRSRSSTPQTDGKNANSADNQPQVDLVRTSASLAELATLLNRWHLYLDFVAQWAPDGLSSRTEKTIRTLVCPMYASLAVFVFRRSVEKAVELNELPTATEFTEEQPLVTSMVDDVMYVFGSLVAQAIDTGIPVAQDPTIAGFRRVLESDYIGTIQRHLKEAAASLRSQPLAFVSYLNTLEVTNEYVAKALDSHDPHERYADFRHGFRVRTNELLADGCQTLNALVFSPQAKQACGQAFKNASYVLEPTQPETRIAAQFELQWRQISRPLRRQLHPHVYDKVVALAASSVAQTLEKLVWSLRGKINDLGAIALDRDISKIISIVSESQYSLRNGFVRVAQMVTLLSDDGDDEMASALSSDELKKLRGLKI